MYRKFLKRFLDMVLAAFALLVLLLPMAVIAAVVKLDSPGPVLFWQKRVGAGKRVFMMPKFRSMYIKAPAEMPTHLLQSPDQWITRSGRILRKTSLDELPQLWSILTGKMSVIGPRPALWNQKDLIAARDRYGVNEIRPGLTGWAQINGRDELEIEEKARLDGEYAQKMSFAFDCRCFFGTVRSVLKQDGIVEGGMVQQQEEIKE